MAAEEECGRSRRLLEDALRPLLAVLDATVDEVDKLTIDPEGPRVIVEATPGWARRVTLDASPDGVELVAAIEVGRGMDPVEVENLVADAVEDADWAAGIEEYDVAYSPETGEAVVTLAARLPSHLPRGRQLARTVREALAPGEEEE